MTFKVQDLHSIIPTEFFTMSSAIIHPLSYHHAKNYHLPTGGVYAASTGTSLLDLILVPEKEVASVSHVLLPCRVSHHHHQQATCLQELVLTFTVSLLLSGK